MQELLNRIGENLHLRVTGPMAFRLMIQPLMATILSARDGVKDARTGREPWLWAVLYSPQHRRELLQNGWKSVSKIFFVAMALDMVYQCVVYRFHQFYLFESVLVAAVLALIPYALFRGPANRIARVVKGSNETGK
jgi:hypothetical protein